MIMRSIKGCQAQHYNTRLIGSSTSEPLFKLVAMVSLVSCTYALCTFLPSYYHTLFFSSSRSFIMPLQFDEKGVQNIHSPVVTFTPL
jgi:hypothetical protein